MRMGYFKTFAIDGKTWHIRELLGMGSFLFEGKAERCCWTPAMVSAIFALPYPSSRQSR
jgi:hypothetical protein